MRRLYLLVAFLLFSSIVANSQKLDTAFFKKNYSQIAEKIISGIMKDSLAWERLAFMCDTYGHRLSGSEGLEQSLDWLVEKMKEDELDNVRKDDVMVPVWRRNKEFCRMTLPRQQDFPMLALGGSIATPPEGITAPVLVVKSFEELDERANEAKGKIVVFNYVWQDYGQAVQYRVWGADAAAKHGALATLIRSVSPVGFLQPHTGMMRYSDTVKRIPHAAITHEDAELLERMQKRGHNPVIELFMEADTLPDVLSSNVLCELTGSEFPDEIIAFGGHIDCWDVGSGAHDDASGCIAAWHVLKVLKDMNLRPRRTLRAVMWANEENGVRGGAAYAEQYKNEKHALMLEWDSGVFPPHEIRYIGPYEVYNIICAFMPLLNKIRPIDALKATWVGVDIGPMMRQNNVPGIGLNTDDNEEYFWYHHAAIDTPDKIDPLTFNQCIAAIALIVYIYADLPIDVMQFNNQN